MPTAIATTRPNKIYKEWASNYEGRYLALFGGAGSGKSIYAIQKFIKRLVNESDGNHKFMFVRKVATTISESIFDVTVNMLSDLGFLPYCKVNSTKHTITFLPNNNRIIMVGVDDREKLKSINNVTGIFIEEATELEKQDFIQIDLRLRGETKHYKQIVFAFNPIEESHWLVEYVEPQYLDKIPNNVENIVYLHERKVWEFDRVSENENGEVVRLKTRTLNTTYSDNKYIDSEYKATLKMLAASSKSYSDVYEFGRWGLEKHGDLFCYQFSQQKHVKNVERNTKNVLHFTVDFNVRPYMSGIVIELEFIENGFWGEHKDFFDLRIIDEFSNEYPNNSAQDLGRSFAEKYNPIEGFFMYGDASGLKNLGVKDTKTHFQDLEKGLGDSAYNIQRRIPTQNPRYKNIAPNSLGRKAFLNLLFSGTLPVRIRINERCKNTILDLKYCQQDGNGGLLKKKNKDGVEERGHHLDALQYFVCHPDTLGYLAKI